MICDQYQSEIFYLAEDDAQSRVILEEHLDTCHNCSLKWQEYQTLLRGYESATLAESPALALSKEPKYIWPLLRIAAILLFGSLVGLFWQKQTKVASVRLIQNEVVAWEPPSLHFSATPLDTQDRDFQERIHYLEDAIATLQVQSSSNQF